MAKQFIVVIFLDKVADHMPNLKTFLKDLEELVNLDLLQYKDCNIIYNKFHEKYLQIIDKNKIL